MARPISLEKSVTRGAKITNYLKDGSSKSTSVFVGDVVEDLSFVSDSKKETITGKVTTIHQAFSRSSSQLNTSGKSTLSSDAKVSDIVVDASAEYDSKIYTIPVQEVLEYGVEEDDKVVRVSVDPDLKVDLKITLSDDSTSEITLTEGIKVSATILAPARTEIDGKFTVTAFTYTVNQKGESYVTGVILVDEDEKATSVTFEAIKTIAVSDPETGGD